MLCMNMVRRFQPIRLLKDFCSLPFQGAERDEESWMHLICTTKFPTSLGMTRFGGVRQQPARGCSALRGAKLILALLLAAASVSLLPSCSGNRVEGNGIKSPAARPAAPVRVAEVKQMAVPVEIRVIGTGEAYSTISVKSMVQGEVQQVYFREGEYVKKGSLLFTIDPRPFQAALDQARANLARDKAQLQNAAAQDKRYTQLFREGIVSQDQYDQFHSNAAALAAAVRADEAAVESAEVQLSYCTIRCPIDGLTGALQIDPGNLVKANDVPMVVINQINPIYVDFSVPQQYLPQIREYQARRPLRVEAIIPSEPNHPEWGTLTFINNTVDANTGTILLKGTFPNPQRRLWPGQYVNVVLNLAMQSNAIVAPSPAIQTGKNGQFAYVVTAQHTVEYRPVSTGSTYQGYTVIEKGLSPGETVVTDGQLLLYPGAKVEIKKSL